MGASVFKVPMTSSLLDVNFMAIVVASVVVTVTIARMVGLLQRRWRIERSFSQFPCYDRHWLLGHMNTAGDRSKFPQMIKDFANRAVYAFQIWQGPFTGTLVTVHPDTVKTILSTSEPKDESVYRLIRPWIGDGLLLSKGHKWARNRRLLTPAFHFEVLRPYTTIFRQSTETLVTKWKRKCNGQATSMEMFNEISLLTLDGLLKCIFTVETNCQNERTKHPYLQGVQDVSEAVGHRGFYVPFFFDPIFELSPTGRKHRQAVKQTHKFTQDVIDERRQTLKEGKEVTKKYVDFLDILLRAKDGDGVGLSNQEIRDEVDTFMFEGHDTTASGLSWMMVNMARNPDFQSKCRQEVDALMESKQGETLEWDDLSQLPYLTMCVKESMRLHPPVPFIRRVITRAMKFPDGRSIPTGSTVGISIYGTHHNPHVWTDPNTYDPERFSSQNIKKIPPFAFVPFSAGPRNCIGQNFALNETKMVAAIILRHFELSIDAEQQPTVLFSLVLRSPKGIHVRVKPRKM